MLPTITKLIEQFKELELKHQIIIGSILLAIIIFIFFTLFASFKSQYIVLQKDLTPKEAAKITKKLRDLNIPFKTFEGGKIVMVPANFRDQALMALAENDLLPKGAKGWSEIFGDKISVFEQTKAIEEERIRRALEGDLAKTISSSPYIYSAAVHIHIEKKDFFSDEEPKRSASVYLTLAPDYKITKKQVRGIRNLVANATGIPEKNVKVFDNNLIDLTRKLDYDDYEESIIMKQITIRERIESNLEEKIASILSIFGPDNVRTRVRVDLDFSKKKEKTVTLAPPVEGAENGMPISAEKETEKWHGSKITPAGVPGTATNVPGYKSVKNGEGDYSRTKERINYEMNKREEMVDYQPYTIKRISVAVFLNSDEVQIDSNHEKQLYQTIAAAAGLDFKRGDTLSLMKVKFTKSYVPSFLEEQIRKQRLSLALSIVGAMLLVASGFLIFMWLKKRKKAAIETIRIKLPQAKPAEVKASAKVANIQKQVIEDLKTRLNEKARKDPKNVASLIKLLFRESL